MAATLGSITVDAVLSRASAERLRVEVEALVAAVRADAAAVRTVGDLTARCVGRLVAVTESDGTVTAGRLDFMEASDDSINLEIRDNGRPRIAIATLDTPIEVLS